MKVCEVETSRLGDGDRVRCCNGRRRHGFYNGTPDAAGGELAILAAAARFFTLPNGGVLCIWSLSTG